MKRLLNQSEIKEFYRLYADRIIEKRFNSPYPLRRYAHSMQYQDFLSYVKPGQKILDAGCGEGVLSVIMAKAGAIVVACDLSQPNITQAKKYAMEQGLSNIEFMLGDLENLPFSDNSFDLVISSHVLEHLPDFDRGLQEIMRVSKNRAIVAIPTILNPCSWTQVGGGWFYLKGPRSFLSCCYGLFKTAISLISFQDGVKESYGQEGVPHVFRFPWVMKKKIKQAGFHLVEYQASTLCCPFFSSLLPIIKFFDHYKKQKFFRDCGYGTSYVIEKIKN